MFSNKNNTIFSKKYQIGVPFAKLAGGHRAHIIVLVNSLKAISLCQTRKYTLGEKTDAKNFQTILICLQFHVKALEKFISSYLHNYQSDNRYYMLHT